MLQSEEDLGSFNIDTITKTKHIRLKDRKGKRDFVLEIANEKTIKVVRILYPQLVITEEKPKGSENLSTRNMKLSINRLGLSFVNSHARELCYTTFSNLRIHIQTHGRDEKLSFKVGDM